MKKIYLGILFTMLMISVKSQDWYPLGDGSGLNNEVMEITEFNGKLVAAGRFYQAGGQQAFAVAQWDGSDWAPMGTGFDDEVRTLAIFNGELYAGGIFHYDGTQTVPFDLLARWDGSQWYNVPVPDPNTVDIRDLYVKDGELYATNNTWVDNVFVGKVSKFNGSSWNDLPGIFTGPLNYIYLYSLGEFQDDLVVTGIFDEVGGIEAQRVALFNGNSWESLDFLVPGETPEGKLDGRGQALIEHDGKLWIGGIFLNFQGTPYSISVASFDGENWSAYPFAEVDGFEIMDFEILNGQLLASGEFGFWEDNQIVTGCALFDTTSANSWRNLNFYNASSGNSKGKSLAIYDGELYIAGNFSHAGTGTTPVNRIARFDGILPTRIFEIYTETEPIKIFPNPSSGYLYFDLKMDQWDEIKSYIIFDLTGRIVAFGKLDSREMDIRSIKPGIYTVELTIAEKRYSARFIRKD
jgi:hypothetical protein